MGVRWHRHRDSQQPLSEQRRRIGGIVGGGDTPEETPIAISVVADNKNFIAGILKSVSGKKQINIFVPQGKTNSLVFLDTGVVEDTEGPVIGSGFDNYIIGKCNSKGYKVDTVGTEILNISIGETIPQWESYVKIPYL